VARRILILVALVVIFVALLVASRSVASWQHTVISGDAGTLLYAATFDGTGTDGFNADWAQYAGRLSAQIANGKAQVNVGEVNGGAYTYADPYFGDFDVAVDAELISGPDANAVGVIFRLQNKDNNAIEDDSYYLFLVSGDGYYRLVRTTDGEPKVLSEWIESPLINLGLNAVNRLRVTASGDQFRFYINDQAVTMCIPDDPNAQSTIHPLTGECMGGAMLDTVTDSSIPNGQVGVGAQWWAEADAQPVVAAFDNLLIYSPQAQTG
jgi:hypothetical protein